MSFQILNKSFRPFRNISWRKLSVLKGFKSRAKCASYNDPVCSEDTIKNQKPCPAKIRRLEANENLPKKNSIWENPECCIDPCPDFFPRFDELYYKSSDKLKKNYQQTWSTCPDIQLKPKRVCSHEKIEFPPMEKRTTKIRPKTACPVGGSHICMDQGSRKCPRVTIPGCRGPRHPPKCKRERSISDCSKECTPYPSYSECLKNQSDPIHPIDCQCLNHPMMCEVWAEMRRRMTFIKG